LLAPAPCGHPAVTNRYEVEAQGFQCLSPLVFELQTIPAKPAVGVFAVGALLASQPHSMTLTAMVVLAQWQEQGYWGCPLVLTPVLLEWSFTSEEEILGVLFPGRLWWNRPSRYIPQS